MITNDVSYLAGFFDGEGSIPVSVCKSKWNKGFYIDLRMEIGNTNYEVLKWAQAVTGLGKVWEHKKKGNRRMQYHLSTGGLQDTRKFLEIIFPFLKIKKRVIKLALNYLDSRLKDLESNKKRINTRNHPYTKEEIETIKKIKLLNSVGKNEKKYEIFCKKLKDWRNSFSKNKKNL